MAPITDCTFERIFGFGVELEEAVVLGVVRVELEQRLWLCAEAALLLPVPFAEIFDSDSRENLKSV